MSREPVISAIIVTRNRERYLQASVESLMRQRLGGEAYEVIVVDNASTDGTAALVRAMQGRYPGLRYVFAGTEGSSRARNAGLEAARAPLVAYLDDDAVAPPRWLAELLAVFRGRRPVPSCVGGKILPLWESAPPPWFPERYLPSLSMLDLGDETCQLADDAFIVGANMAFVKADLLAAGGFNDEISLYADEVCVQDRIRRKGGTVVYAPRAWVHHHVPEGRLTVDYICQRKYRGGKGEVAVLYERMAGARSGLGARAYLWANALGRPLHIARLYCAMGLNRALDRAEAALECRIQIHRSRGMMEEAWRLLGKGPALSVQP